MVNIFPYNYRPSDYCKVSFQVVYFFFNYVVFYSVVEIPYLVETSLLSDICYANILPVSALLIFFMIYFKLGF